MSALLDVSDLSKNFGGLQGCRQTLSFSLERG